MSLFVGIQGKHTFGVGCRSPPFNLDFNDFENSDWRKLKWHITTDGKNANGVSEKKPRKRFYESMVSMRIPLKKSAPMTERSLILTGGFAVGQAISENTLRE